MTSVLHTVVCKGRSGAILLALVPRAGGFFQDAGCGRFEWPEILTFANAVIDVRISVRFSATPLLMWLIASDGISKALLESTLCPADQD